jgi:hypothetical protein
MGLIRIWYEQIKPIIIFVIVGISVWLVVANIMESHRVNDIAGTLERVDGDLVAANKLIGSVISDFSGIEEGIVRIEATSDHLQKLERDLELTSDRLEKAILGLGDTSTESGILADRLYRISRELAGRGEKDSQ